MNRIKELRQTLNLTQKELAEKVGFNQTAIGKYERNELEPNLETLKKLSAIFECSIDYLVGYSDDFGNVTVQQKSPADALTPTEQELLNNFRSLPRAEQTQISEYARILAIHRGTKKNIKKIKGEIL